MATETLEGAILEEKEPTEEMDLEMGEKDKEDQEEEVGSQEEEKVSEDRGKKRGRGGRKLKLKIEGDESNKSANPNEPATPVERPSRERKTVERFSALSSRRVSAAKLPIPKGRGTQLKDIPNVAFKLLKRKPDENLQKLYQIIFGKRGKTKHLKREINQFSGFVWVDNEEKQREKIKERIEKCVKEKLLDFCDVLDIPHKSTSKKEELSEKLLDFLESPHATREVLLSEKEQSRKDKKRKRKVSASTKKSRKASGEGSSKRKKHEVKQKRKQSSEAGEESEDDEAASSDDRSDSGEDSDHGMVYKEESGEVSGGSEEMGNLEEEEEHKERASKKNTKVSGKKSIKDPVAKTSVKRRTSAKSARSLAEAMESEKGPEELKDDKEEEQIKGSKVSGQKGIKESIPTPSPEKSTPTKSGKSPAKPMESHLPSVSEKPAATDDELSASPSKSKGSKKKQPKRNEKKTQTLPSKKSSSKSGGKLSVKQQGTVKPKGEPSNEEMHSAVSKILKEVDFDTATLSDIVRQLGTVFGIDLMHRKKEVKGIIEEVMKNMSDEEEEAEESADGDDAGVGNAAQDDGEKDGEDSAEGDTEAAAVKNVGEVGDAVKEGEVQGDVDEEGGKEAQGGVAAEELDKHSDKSES